MKRISKVVMAMLLTSGIIYETKSSAAQIQFLQNREQVACYEYVEVTAVLDTIPQGNPFTDLNFSGTFGSGEGTISKVEGFCDSPDGKVFRIRFMPSHTGDYTYSVKLSGETITASHSGRFKTVRGTHSGIVRIDPVHPSHFIWDGSGKHYFWNSTTTYWLLGWQDEAIIRESLDRLAGLGINRIRVALNARTHNGMRWKEPLVLPSQDFQFRLAPWPAARPDNIENPGYDLTRFAVSHFQKTERMLQHADKLGIVVSLIFHLDGADQGVDPFGKENMGKQDEQRYYRYCIARFAAFANIMWDVTNEWHLFRNETWVETMGKLIKQYDPYNHTTSVHGTGHFPFRSSAWCDYAMYQCWDEHGGYDFMLKQRREQEKTGKPMPQINEEYGYEDHYPYPWGEKRKWPLRIAESRRKLAWEISMAGAYQTTGERANILGYGGWITGRGNE